MGSDPVYLGVGAKEWYDAGQIAPRLASQAPQRTRKLGNQPPSLIRRYHDEANDGHSCPEHFDQSLSIHGSSRNSLGRQDLPTTAGA